MFGKGQEWTLSIKDRKKYKLESKFGKRAFEEMEESGQEQKKSELTFQSLDSRQHCQRSGENEERRWHTKGMVEA